MVNKKSKKSDVSTDKIGVVDFVQSLKDVDDKKINTFKILHNSRDKYDGVWINRLYNDKFIATDVSDFKVDGATISFKATISFDGAKIIKASNDCIVLTDKKHDVLLSKILKDGAIIDFDVAQHNDVVLKNQMDKKSTKSLLSDLSDDDLSKVKDFIATLKGK
jgi:hypothetical protein